MGVISDNIKRSLGDEIELTEKEKEIAKKTEVYFESINSEKETIKTLNLDYLKGLFIETFKFENNRDIVFTQHNKPIYDLIAKYFSRDVRFLETDLVLNLADLEKGLLIIGDYGCGKTSMLNTYHKIGYKFLPDTFLWFSKNSCLSIVSEYEQIKYADGKEEFNDKYYNTSEFYFDDFGTENDASNFGKKNLLKDILEERYARKKKTHITTNLSLGEIKNKYGDRVFDRLQEMFNIIEMKGNSFRQ